MKAFFKTCLAELCLMVITLLVVGFIFYLSPLEPAYGRLCLIWLLFIDGCYLIIRFWLFNHQVQLKAQLAKRDQELYDLKSQMLRQQKDLDDYFIHWIHQIKTPIAAIRLMLDSQVELSKNDLEQQMLAIDNYTRTALAYLKIQNPATDLMIQPIVLDDLIAPLLQRYRWSFIYNHTRLEYHPIKDQVITDGNWTQLMIEQILNNALKYGKGTLITIRYNSQDQVLLISDQGLGIPDSDLKKFFDKGYSGFNGQLHCESSGLGLYLVDQISQRLHQKVTVRSEPGQGTCFTITFNNQLTKL